MTRTARGNSGGRQSVGLIGLGQMGGAICRSLLRHRWRVVVWDVAPAAVEAASVLGAEPAADPAAVAARVQLIITSLPDAAAVRAVALGSRGIALEPRHDLLLADTSTISPEEARSLAADLAPRGVWYIDAPLSGGARGAEDGTLAVMVGGSPEHVARARAALSSIGRAVVHCGPVGAGQIAKACNQLIVMAAHASMAEAFVLATTSGLDPWRLLEVLTAGYVSSPIVKVQGPRMLSHNFVPGGKASFHLKDISIISRLAAEGGIDVPVFDAAALQMARLIEAGGGDLDNSAVITVVERQLVVGNPPNRSEPTGLGSPTDRPTTRRLRRGRLRSVSSPAHEGGDE